jgi:acetylornithine deacetylase/succinyl-diaminopimelate desuccinylase-like protein
MLRLGSVLIGLALAVAARGAPPAALPTTPDAVRREARDIFATAIGFETSVGRGQVPALAEYLAERFRSGGFPAGDVTVVPLGETASLVVRYRGTGTGGRPIAFLAHLDVVAARREDWQRDPFTLTEENGYFFGRGTFDVKSEVALLTATFLRLRRAGVVPTRDLILVFTGDEETDQATTQDLVTNHRDLVAAEFVLNADGGGGVFAEDDGRPLFYYVQGAEKSSAALELTVRNPGGHSAYPRTDNAIYELADALQAVRRLQFPVRWNDWTVGSFKAAGSVTPGALGAAMQRFAAHPGDAAAAAELSREPLYVGMLRTTCVATLLRGGHAQNALPQSATATINCRIFPGTRPGEVRDTLQRAVGSHAQVTLAGDPLVSDPSPMRRDVMIAVSHAVEAAHPGTTVAGSMVAYATDGTVFRHAGIPTYGVSGLFIKDSEVFAHGLNERVGVAAFYAALTHWYVLIDDLAGPR